jgi:glycosyltransferase involved in cell wall biosynthesis
MVLNQPADDVGATKIGSPSAPVSSSGPSPVPSLDRVRVGVETTGIYTTNAGVARYVRGLLRGLGRVGGHDAFELGWPVENLKYQQPARALKTVYREYVWGKMLAPRELLREKAAVVHSTSSMFIRPPRGVKHVITLHDISISRHPERFRKWQIKSWNRRLGALAKADKILSISQFTSDEAMKLLGLPASTFEIVHNGSDFHPDEPRAPERAPDAEFAVPSEFFLFIGSLEPGKNLALLKRAYTQAESEGKLLPPLVIVGARWQGVPGEGPPPKGWIYMGRQDDQILVWLYRRALALVFPSIYEGFGLPVVEANAMDCPVICSPASSLPEVAGEAALFTEMSPEAYLQSMRKLVTDQSTRQALIEAGRQNCRRFSWTRCAEQTVAVYHQAIA